jgi:hypothetical protein
MVPLGHARWMSVVRQVPILMAALFLAVALGRGAVQAGPDIATVLSAIGGATAEPVYSAADLQRQVIGDPRRWIGRTVRVRGRAAMDRSWSAPDSIVTSIELLDPGTPGGTTGLSLAWGGADPRLVALRSLPLIGGLAPRPQVLHFGTRATYRVRLRAATAGACESPPCYEAVLLDALPP